MAPGFSSGFGRFAIGPGRLLVDALDQTVSQLIGRELDITFGSARTHLRPRAVRCSPTPFGMVTGRMDCVDAELEHVRWEGGRIDELLVHARNVHVAPGLTPHLVAGPVDLLARLDQGTLDDWLDRAGVEWRVRLAGDGTVEVRRPGREHWGHAVFSADARGHTLTLVPEEVFLRGRRVRRAVQRYGRTLTFEIPPLPGGARVLGVRPAHGVLEVSGVVDRIREPITYPQIRQIQRAITALSGTELVLPRVGD